MMQRMPFFLSERCFVVKRFGVENWYTYRLNLYLLEKENKSTYSGEFDSVLADLIGGGRTRE